MHFHPKDTVEAFKPANKEKIAHLWYHLHYNQKEQRINQENGKVKYLSKKRQSAPIVSQELKQFSQVIEKQRQQAFAELTPIYYIRQLKATLLSRVIHGLGGGHVNETSLTLHPVYGIPYIPASSVKGLVRDWFIQAYCDGKEEKLVENEWGKFVFGSQENRGAIQFYDILLHENLQIERDILTVHFKKYYSKKDSATDTQDPHPIPFWTVNVKDANIFFTIPKDKLSSNQANELLNAVVIWVCQAFTEFGIGSKTSLGYGLFSEVIDVTNKELEKVIAEQQERKKRQQYEQQKRAQQEKIIREQQEEALRIASMPKEEKLLYEIQVLSDSQVDLEKSKTLLYEEVISQQNVKAAAALKNYWEKTGQWKVKKQKQKQYAKVQEIKKLLQ